MSSDNKSPVCAHAPDAFDKVTLSPIKRQRLEPSDGAVESSAFLITPSSFSAVAISLQR